MSNTHTTLTSLFTDIADAIRNKTGSTEAIVADNFPDAINNFPTLEELTSDADATTEDILVGKTAYVDGAKVEGSFDIEAELNTQVSLLEQIDTAFKTKVGGDS